MSVNTRPTTREGTPGVDGGGGGGGGGVGTTGTGNGLVAALPPLAGQQPARFGHTQSFVNIRTLIEGSVFGKKRRKGDVDDEEEEHKLGLPDGIDEDTGDQFARTFQELESLGEKMEEKSAIAQGDKVVFAARKVAVRSGTHRCAPHWYLNRALAQQLLQNPQLGECRQVKLLKLVSPN
ncbi:hypothetical protein HK104_002789 [Borealophlyctis nickersoniae]|nr:hypothetical protein HK104_002789 [Borealophlyctis nickersoniae]